MREVETHAIGKLFRGERGLPVGSVHESNPFRALAKVTPEERPKHSPRYRERVAIPVEVEPGGPRRFFGIQQPPEAFDCCGRQIEPGAPDVDLPLLQGRPEGRGVLGGATVLDRVHGD